MLELLEDRTVPATLSITDASLTEIGSPSAYVAPGSGGLDSPKDITLGPDGNLYVASSATNSIIRYNGATGQLIGTFVAAGSGGLSGPYGLAFGPDGHLYVGGGAATNFINRYHGTTGAFMNTFVPTGSGGLDFPLGLAFGGDGNLYVSSRNTDSVMRYQGPLEASPGDPLPAAGQPGATFVATGSGGLDDPFDLTFGPDGNLYVASTLSASRVLRFDGATGTFIDGFVAAGDSLSNPRGLTFDQDGRLYVADVDLGAIRRYDATGNHLDDPVPAGSGSVLTGAIGLVFDRTGNLLIASRDTDAVVRYTAGVLVTLSEASASPVSVDYATTGGTATANTDFTSQSGTVTFAPGQTSRRILLATRDDGAPDASETFTIDLSNPTGGATIADGTAAVTITDDEASRQITITDASAIEGDNRPHYRGSFIDGIPGGHFNPLAFGPDGYVYTAVGTGIGYNTIQRYDAATGAFIDTFVPQGRINGVRDIVFRDGFMYVASSYTDEVLRYNATTGAFVDAFVTANSGGIDHPDGMLFGPDTNSDGIPELYVTGWLSHSVVRYDGATGQPLGTFITAESGGLSYPFSLAFGPGGVFVTSAGTNQILKYNSTNGAYLGVVASTGLDYPRGLTFGPDGLLYVTSGDNDRILRFTSTGTYVDDFVPAGAGGMDDPRTPRFGPDGDLYVTSTGNAEILRFGTAPEVLFTVSVSAASPLPLTVAFSTADGSAVSGSDFAAVSGTLTFAPGQTKRTVLVPTLNDTTAESAESFSLVLSNPVGATITDGTGVATITDDDATKFFVVNDGSSASSDKTYRYGTPGNGQASSALNSGNTAPRGVASTAAGDKVWVVDANRKVYVYSAAGATLGSWTAGTMSSSATPEGIATNGTDVWIVDTKSDKVYRYSNAAGRLSGSQNAASSFSLNTANKNSKGIVTDGSSLWVVDDSTMDLVFKYTLSGSLLGSWTMTGGGGSPTGVTLDPGAPAHLWVVDNATDRVYQYDNAVGRTTGSQSMSASFALAAGNTNPQDIADPPFGAVTPVVDHGGQARKQTRITPIKGALATLSDELFAGHAHGVISSLRARAANGLPATFERRSEVAMTGIAFPTSPSSRRTEGVSRPISQAQPTTVPSTSSRFLVDCFDLVTGFIDKSSHESLT